jgi:hypothetical protein
MLVWKEGVKEEGFSIFLHICLSTDYWVSFVVSRFFAAVYVIKKICIHIGSLIYIID